MLELHETEFLQQEISLSASLCIFSRFKKAVVIAVHGYEGIARYAEISDHGGLLISATAFISEIFASD